MNTRRALRQALVALVVLNMLLSFGNAWPTLWPRPEARLSIDLAAVVLGLSLLSLHGPLRRATVVWTSAVLATCVLLHYLNVTVPAVLGRRLDLYWDGQHAWEVLKMGAASPSAMKFVGVAVIVALAIAALYRLIRRGVATLAESLQSARLRIGLVAASTAVLGAGLLAPQGLPALQHAFAPSVGTLVAEQARLLHRAHDASDDERLLGASPAFDGTLGALAGADVVIVFAEAYGAVTLDNPDLSSALAASRQRLADAVDASGHRVLSARLVSPTFGGGSWLAHAELLSGLDMRDPNDYRLLLTTQRPTLVSHFAAHGYRTVGWMPGIQRPWPEGRFYGFDRIADADGIGYRGSLFGYWRIPDQASMAQLQAQELGPQRDDARRPRLVVFPTVSTHAPFRPLAPYVTDWSAVLGADAYDSPDAVSARQVPASWDDPVPAYLSAVRYQFDWLAGWLSAHAPADAVVIVVGDHQPMGTVTGPDADWDVPMHVITGNAVLLDRLAALGFQPGLEPDRPALGRMASITSRLVEVFAGE